MSRPAEICREIQLDPRPGSWTRSQREHAGVCPGCGSFLASLAALTERLRGLSSTTRALPEPLRRQLLSRLDEAPGPAPATGSGPARSRRSGPKAPGRTFRSLAPLGMAASLALGVFLENRFDLAPAPMPAEVGEVQATVGDYIHDVTHDHYLFERIRRPLEVEMAEAGRLSEWLSASLDFELRLPSESGSLALEGGRVWHTVGRLSAMAVYRADDGTRVVLFAVPAENLTPDGAESQWIAGTRVFHGGSWGHEARAWIQGDLAVSLTAPEGHVPDGWERVFLPSS